MNQCLYKHYPLEKKNQYKYDPSLFIFFPFTYGHFLICVYISKPI